MPSVIVFLVTVAVENEIDNQMVLGPVSSTAKLHCTVVFALHNGKFSKLGVTHPVPS